MRPSGLEGVVVSMIWRACLGVSEGTISHWETGGNQAASNSSALPASGGTALVNGAPAVRTGAASIQTRRLLQSRGRRRRCRRRGGSCSHVMAAYIFLHAALSFSPVCH